MNTVKHDGGGAFPSPPSAWGTAGPFTHSGTTAGSVGMSLRDYFAAHALPGIAFDCGLSKEEAAARAYEFADAMLAERSR